MKKLIKKLVLKYLEKYTGNEFTQMDNRIYDIEVKLGIKSFSAESARELLEEMMIKDAEHIKPGFIAEMELTELPEYWLVKRTKENYKIINKWACDILGKKFKDQYNLVSNSGNIFGHKPKGYTEISFSDFERLVLKKEVLENTEQMEVGRWYKKDDSKFLACITSFPNNNEYCSCYGFNGNGLYTEMGRKTDGFIPASKEEVETAMINEAKKRGFENIQQMRFEPYENRLVLNIHGFGIKEIFNNGKWAEVIEQPKQEIDFSVPGQFINIAYGNYASTVITNGKHDNTTFEGMCIESTVDKQIGNFSSKWSKDIPGSITLKN